MEGLQLAIYDSENVDSKIKEVYVVSTGNKTKISPEEKESHEKIFEYFKNRGKITENKPTFRIVNTEETKDGKLLVIVEETNYAHFLAWNNRKDPEIEKIIGDAKLTPCQVANPQTGILAKPEIVESINNEQGRAKQLLTKLKSKGPQILFGKMGKSTAFEGTVQAFGKALYEDDSQKESRNKIIAYLRDEGFEIIDNIDFGNRPRRWNLSQIVNDSIQEHAGIDPKDIGTPIFLAPVSDTDGNLFFPFITPVHQTKKEIITNFKKLKKSKFEDLISLPLNSKKAKSKMKSQNLKYKAYVPKVLEHVKQLIPKNRRLASFSKIAKTIGNAGLNTRQFLHSSVKRGIDYGTKRLFNLHNAKGAKKKDPASEKVDRYL